MFGYVVVNKPELKIREFEEYQGYYCGLCKSLKKSYGFWGQMSLSFDMTFLIILLSGLYEPRETKSREHCKEHILKKNLRICNEFSDYAADMNVLLTYYKLIDDWEDDKKLSALVAAGLLRKEAGKAKRRHGFKASFIRVKLKELKRLEKHREKNIDRTAGCFGEITREIFLCRRDEWEEELGRMGFYMGKFLYLADALDDLEEDSKKGEYNPFLVKYDSLAKKGEYKKIRKEAEKILVMMMSETSKSFERLPVVKNSEIIRNILYAGVWVKLKDERKCGKENKRTVENESI